MSLQARHLIFFSLLYGIFKIPQNAILDNIASLRMQKHPYLPIQTFGDSNLQLGDNSKITKTSEQIYSLPL